MNNAVGRPPDPLRKKYIDKYQLKHRRAKELTPQFLIQLEQCQTEEARRLILGVEYDQKQRKHATKH